MERFQRLAGETGHQRILRLNEIIVSREEGEKIATQKGVEIHLTGGISLLNLEGEINKKTPFRPKGRRWKNTL